MEVYYAVQHYEIAELTPIEWMDDLVGTCNNICPRSMHAGLALGIRIPYVVPPRQQFIRSYRSGRCKAIRTCIVRNPKVKPSQGPGSMYM